MIGGPSELRSAFAAMAKAETQAVVVQAFLAGGLVSMAANLPELYERSALYVDKILKGRSCPLYPQKRTCSVQLEMSALCHRRHAAAHSMAPIGRAPWPSSG